MWPSQDAFMIRIWENFHWTGYELNEIVVMTVSQVNDKLLCEKIKNAWQCLIDLKYNYNEILDTSKFISLLGLIVEA